MDTLFELVVSFIYAAWATAILYIILFCFGYFTYFVLYGLEPKISIRIVLAIYLAIVPFATTLAYQLRKWGS